MFTVNRPVPTLHVTGIHLCRFALEIEERACSIGYRAAYGFAWKSVGALICFSWKRSSTKLGMSLIRMRRPLGRQAYTELLATRSNDNHAGQNFRWTNRSGL